MRRSLVLALVVMAVLGLVVLLRLSGADLQPVAVSDLLRGLGDGRGGVWSVVAPVILIVALAAVLVVPVLPALIFQVGSGLAFGPGVGFVYAVLADVLGASLGFWLARRWGMLSLQRWLKPPTIARIEGLARRLNWQSIVLLRLLPGPAYPLVSFAAGISQLSFRRYLAASFVGVVPSLALLAFAGDIAATSWWLAAVIVVVFVASMALVGRLLKQDTADS
jgi:uncharacterized membrane protein YdjX (TVP38/TMEM64 family)